VHVTPPVRGIVHDRNAMTSTIKNFPDLNSPGKPGAPSQNSENKTRESSRSNPVCLEVSVTIRSLPNEAGGLNQPVREEGKTVIVFDNGAVLRSTLNLPAGLKVIISNPSGRDVVSQVVGGRNMPSLKGYVEVEFVEPVNDFWGIHQDTAPTPIAVAAPPASSPVTREIPAPPAAALSAPPRKVTPEEAPAKLANVSLGAGPKFEDKAEPASALPPAAMRESKTEKMRPIPQPVNNDVSDYNLSAYAKPESLANWLPSAAEPQAAKSVLPAKKETASIVSPPPANSHDFLSKGLMAYDQPGSSSGASDGRAPLIVGVAALVLAGICGAVFFMHRGNDPSPDAKTAFVTQPSTQQTPPTASAAPEPAQTPQDESAPAAAQAQNQAQPVSVEQSQPVPAVAPVPAVVTGPANLDERTDSRNIRRQEKNAVVAKQPELSPARRPAIPNLKIGSPSAPNQNHAGSGDAAAPITEIASADPGGSSPPAGLLTSAGRISNPPSPPPGAPAPAAPAPVSAPKTVREPKLISSVRPDYPAAARQANVQGSVTILATIDENGKVVNAKALGGPLLLRLAAENSVKQWKYSPGLVDGKPTPSQATVGVEFRIN